MDIVRYLQGLKLKFRKLLGTRELGTREVMLHSITYPHTGRAKTVETGPGESLESVTQARSLPPWSVLGTVSEGEVAWRGIDFTSEHSEII